MKKTSCPKLFISHSVSDLPVVKAFVTLIEAGIGVHATDIFCTSLKGQGIKPGADFKTSIHKHLDDATTVVALISENFYNSPFCMCELGGAWLQSKDFIPILVPPVRFTDMKAVLIGLQALRINSPEELDELRDEIAQRLEITPLSTPRWNEKRDEFIARLKDDLKKIPSSPNVPRSQLDNAKKKSDEYENLLNESETEVEKLKKINAKLKKVKDAEAVTKIIAEDMSAIEVFESHVENARRALAELDPITCEAIFLSWLGQELMLTSTSRFSWEDAQRPLQYKQLTLNSYDDGVVPNESNKKVKSALTELRRLNKWLGDTAPEDFHEWYSESHDGCTPDLTDRAFWDNGLW